MAPTAVGKFWPAPARKALDARSGFVRKNRERHDKVRTELARHPTRMSVVMMRPRRDGDAQGVPFVEEDSLEEVLYEIARLAVKLGAHSGSLFSTHG